MNVSEGEDSADWGRPFLFVQHERLVKPRFAASSASAVRTRIYLSPSSYILTYLVQYMTAIPPPALHGAYTVSPWNDHLCNNWNF